MWTIGFVFAALAVVPPLVYLAYKGSKRNSSEK
jgi:hypothetical protein